MYKYVIILFFIILGTSCQQQNAANKKIVQLQQEALQTPNTNTNVIAVLDSLKADNSIPNKQLFMYACENLFQYNKIHFDTKYLTQQFLKDHIQVLPFNGNFLVVIDNNHFFGNVENHLWLGLYTKNCRQLATSSISGCHYHNGQVTVTNWDNSGENELVFTINAPTQSVPVIGAYTTVYKCSKATNFTFAPIFDLETKFLDGRAWTNRPYGVCKTRSYQFVNTEKIEVTEVEYHFDCNTFDFERKCTENERIRNKTYTMLWNPHKLAFEE